MSTTTPTDSVGSNEHKAAPIQVRPRFRRILIVGGAVLAIALVVGFIPQLRQRQTAVADTKQLAIPTVAVVSPTVTTPGSGLNLPAEVKPWQEASIFARVNGYLKDWLVDIGAHVEKDQLLADIDTPDLDQQLAQANSQAVLAKRNLDQAKSTNTKWQELYKQGVVSQLDAENQATSQGTNQANTEAFAANLRFLEQEDASNIAAGQTFDVQVGAQSAKTYPGKVISTSGAVSPDSRTMLVELQVDNSKNQILPGSYATVRVPEVALGKLVTLPDNTLIFRGKSVQVGIVDAKG